MTVSIIRMHILVLRRRGGAAFYTSCFLYVAEGAADVSSTFRASDRLPLACESSASHCALEEQLHATQQPLSAYRK